MAIASLAYRCNVDVRRRRSNLAIWGNAIIFNEGREWPKDNGETKGSFHKCISIFVSATVLCTS